MAVYDLYFESESLHLLAETSFLKAACKGLFLNLLDLLLSVDLLVDSLS